MRPPVRVLQVLGRSAGGMARHVAHITEEIDADERFSIRVAAPSDLPVSLPNVELWLEIPDGPRGHREIIGRLRAHVVQEGYEVVHAHGLRAGIDSGIAVRDSGARRLLTVHNLVRPEVAGRARAAAYRFAEPWAVSVSDRVFAVSSDIAASLRRWRPRSAQQIEVLHLGAGPAPAVTRDRAEVRARLGVPDNGRLIVTVARLAPQKALDVMIDALSRLDAGVFLAILGEGPLQHGLQARAAERGVADRIRWLGFRSDVADHLAAADIFCLSSVWEGVPLAAMEAIALQVPVVATAVGGMPELIRDGSSGRLVPPGEPAALAEALAEALSHPDLARERSKQALSTLHTGFSTRSMLDRLRAEYLEAVHVG